MEQLIVIAVVIIGLMLFLAIGLPIITLALRVLNAILKGVIYLLDRRKAKKEKQIRDMEDPYLCIVKGDF